MSTNGKGSKPRPMSVSRKEYGERWDEVFGGKWSDGQSVTIKHGFDADNAYIEINGTRVSQKRTPETQLFIRMEGQEEPVASINADEWDIRYQ